MILAEPALPGFSEHNLQVSILEGPNLRHGETIQVEIEPTRVCPHGTKPALDTCPCTWCSHGTAVDRLAWSSSSTTAINTHAITAWASGVGRDFFGKVEVLRIIISASVSERWG